MRKNTHLLGQCQEKMHFLQLPSRSAPITGGKRLIALLRLERIALWVLFEPFSVPHTTVCPIQKKGMPIRNKWCAHTVLPVWAYH